MTHISREDITFWIAIIGAAISIFNLARDMYRSRFRIRVRLKGYGVIPVLSDQEFLFKMTIENCSRLPVSISRVVLHLGNSSYDFESVPHPAYNSTCRTGKETTDQIKVRTISIPQTIQGLGVLGDYFYVITEPSVPNLLESIPNVGIEIITNRGRKTFKMDSIWSVSGKNQVH